MSIKYKSSKEVPLEAIISRLRELSDAITDKKTVTANEFTMRIPAECDRDADLILYESANRLSEFKERITELENALNEAADEIEHFMEKLNWNGDADKYRAIAKGEKE